MRRRVFYSFHFANDAWRASEVRLMGALEGDEPVSYNEWEKVRRGGSRAIQNWVDNQMIGKSCVVVLVGSETASRPWIHYEIKKGWTSGKGVLGIRIHGLKDASGNTHVRGDNPFDGFRLGAVPLSSIVNCWNPSGDDSKRVYASIKVNLARLVEESIAIRAKY